MSIYGLTGYDPNINGDEPVLCEEARYYLKDEADHLISRLEHENYVMEQNIQVEKDLLQQEKNINKEMREALETAVEYMIERGVSHEYPVLINAQKSLKKARGES